MNSLLRKAALQTFKLTSTPSDSPTTTTHPQEVSLELEDKQVRLIDTPGLSWQPVEDASEEDRNRTRAKDVLLRSRGRIERLKDPSPVCKFPAKLLLMRRGVFDTRIQCRNSCPVRTGKT